MPTPNMNLDLPTVSSTLGPEWASLLNAALELVDSHDHSSGKGTQVTPAGILINATLNMLSEALQDANSLGMANRGSADTNSYALGSMQIIDNDLYFVNSAASSIQITDGNSIVNLGGRFAPKAITSPYTVSAATDVAAVLLADTSSAAVSITLPASLNNGGFYCFVKDVNGNAQTNNITINRSGSDTIDGDTSFVIDYNYGSSGFISDNVSQYSVI